MEQLEKTHSILLNVFEKEILKHKEVLIYISDIKTVCFSLFFYIYEIFLSFFIFLAIC